MSFFASTTGSDRMWRIPGTYLRQVNPRNESLAGCDGFPERISDRIIPGTNLWQDMKERRAVNKL